MTKGDLAFAFKMTVSLNYIPLVPKDIKGGDEKSPGHARDDLRWT